MEEVTEKVKAVKVEEKPKDVKTEVVDEVLMHTIKYQLFNIIIYIKKETYNML